MKKDEELTSTAQQAEFETQATIDAPFPVNGSYSPIPQTSFERQQAASDDQPLDVDELLHKDSEKERLLNKSKTVFYLAYGSNMSSQTFRKTRRISPISQVNVYVPDLALTFDLPGVPYLEPCFAGTKYRDQTTGLPIYPGESPSQPLGSSDESPGNKNEWRKPLVGVVYEVSLSDYARIIATEGGGSSYVDIVVNCHPFPTEYDPNAPVPEVPDTKAFMAHTLLSPTLTLSSDKEMSAKKNESYNSSLVHRPDPNYAQPSLRYKNLLVTGSQEHNLPAEYRKYISAVPTYKTTSIRQVVGKVLFGIVWFPLLLCVFKVSSLMANDKGRSPWLLEKCQRGLFKGIWWTYDVVFKRLFGNGERRIDDGPHKDIKLN